MPSFLPDTSCMVPAVVAWHQHHARATGDIDRRLDRGERMIVAGPALVESYSVLSRLPRPHRLPARGVLAALQTAFMDVGEIVALDGDAYAALLRQAPAEGVVGGRIYDALIAACARAARATALLTFNERDFLPFADPDLEIVVPGQA